MAGTEEGAGNGNALGLSFAEAAALFVEVSVYSVGEGEDEVGTGGAEGLEHFRLAGMRVTHEEVIADGAAEKSVALGDVDEVGACLGRNFESGKLGIES